MNTDNYLEGCDNLIFFRLVSDHRYTRECEILVSEGSASVNENWYFVDIDILVFVRLFLGRGISKIRTVRSCVHKRSRYFEDLDVSIFIRLFLITDTRRIATFWWLSVCLWAQVDLLEDFEILIFVRLFTRTDVLRVMPFSCATFCSWAREDRDTFVFVCLLWSQMTPDLWHFDNSFDF